MATATIPESNEGNNTRTKAITINAPDLTVSALTAPTVGGQGQAISITDTTKNGTAAGTTPVSTTSFYLSSDNVLDAGDVLFGSRAVPSLVAGATDTATTSQTIPAGFDGRQLLHHREGRWPGVLAESNETNNTRSKAITIGADLSVTALGAPATSGAGLTIAVTDTTKNATGRSDAPASTTAFYLSRTPRSTPATYRSGRARCGTAGRAARRPRAPPT